MLTDAGRRYAQEVGNAFGVLEAASHEATRKGKSDLLTVHVVPSLGSQWLMPRLARFCAKYPDIDLRVTASGDHAALQEGVIDFHISYGPVLRRAGIENEPFPPEPIVVLCSPSLTRGASGLQYPGDIGQCLLIHTETNLYTWRDWQNDHRGLKLNLERGLRFDSSVMSIYAAADGMGVCLESRLLVERQLSAETLVLPFGREGPRIQCHSLSYLSSRAKLPKMRVFQDWLHQALAESPALQPSVGL